MRHLTVTGLARATSSPTFGRGEGRRSQLMTLAEYNAFCASLSRTTSVIQWGGSHVRKIGGKVFVIGVWGADSRLAVSFKCSEMVFQMLNQEPELRSAPYLALRGVSWIQWQGPESMSFDELKDYVLASYRLVAKGLIKVKQRELGFLVSCQGLDPNLSPHFGCHYLRPAGCQCGPALF